MGILGLKTEYSFYQSILKIENLPVIIKEGGYEFIATSDSSNIFACYKLKKLAKEANIKFITGVNINTEINNLNYNFLVYPKNENGYENLLKILKIINFEKRNLLITDLKKYEADLIFVTNGSDNFLYQLASENIAKTDYVLKYIKVKLNEYMQILSNTFSNLYIGLSLDFPDEIFYKTSVISEIALKNKIKTIPVHSTRYFKKEDKFYYEEFINLKNKKENKELSNNYDFSFWSKKELEERFSAYPEAVKSLNSFSEQINFSFDIKKLNLPKIDQNPDSKIKKEAVKTLKTLNLSESDYRIYETRLTRELNVISKKGFSNYFLIISEILKLAKKRNILIGPGRGSACASLTAYLLKITSVDPIKYNLYFERFLNSERNEMPDIDIDLPSNMREEVYKLCMQKFGFENIAFITTFEQYQTKSLARDLIKSKSMPEKNIEKLVKDYENDITTNFPELIDIMKKLNGLKKTYSMHPAGVIFSNEKIDEKLPVLKAKNDYLQIGFELSDLASAEILKTDFLSLQNLKIIDDTIKLIKQSNHDFNFNKIPLNDNKTFQLLKKGETENIFQLESNGITNAIKKIKLKNINDLINLIALYRPGPLKNLNEYIERSNGKKFQYLHDSLKDILSETYGIILFQEQIMKIAIDLANYSHNEADNFRRGISKKDLVIIEEEKPNFIEAMLRNNFTYEVAENIFTYILKFADYGFNKAHSVAYSIFAYKMAYLKANYPYEFSVSILNNFINDEKIISKNINLLIKKGLKIYPPEINIATNYFNYKDEKLVLPFKIIKKMPDDIIEKIIKLREEKKFSDYKDFILRTNDFINDDLLINLIFANCFYRYSKNHKDLFLKKEEYLLDGLTLKKNEVKNFSDIELAENEAKVFGFNIFFNIEKIMKNYANKKDIKLLNPDPFSGTYIAKIISKENSKTKAGKQISFLEAECFSGDKISLVCFQEDLDNIKEVIITGRFYIIEIEKNKTQRESYILKNAIFIN